MTRAKQKLLGKRRRRAPVDSLGHVCGCTADVDRGGRLVKDGGLAFAIGFPGASGAANVGAIRPTQWDGQAPKGIHRETVSK